MRNLSLTLLCSGAALLSACGATTPEAPASTEPPEANHPTQPPAASRYEVHEWGLVDVARDGQIELAAGPGQVALAAPQPNVVPPNQAVARKPVLYFHLLEGEVELSVQAAMTYGNMLEHFPRSQLSGPTVAWQDVQVVDRACGDTDYPSAGSPGCQTSDGYCEAAELELYEASDASCLVVDGNDYNHLFYRGGGTGLALPFRVNMSSAQTTLTNTSEHTIPYALLISDGRGGSPEAGRDRRQAGTTEPVVNIRRFGTIPAGESAEVREAISAEDAIAAVRGELGTLGLTSAETQAFMNAWEQAVFRAPNVGRSVVLLLPAELVDTVSILTLSPAPEVVRRAMMVRLELPVPPL